MVSIWVSNVCWRRALWVVYCIWGAMGMAAVVSSCLPKVCLLAGTVLMGFGILEPRLGFGPAGNHFCAI
jgi:hypothetical protein